MRLICVRTKAEYFSIPHLTRFLKIRSDLPVVPSCRRPLHKVALARKANRFAVHRVAEATASPSGTLTMPFHLPPNEPKIAIG
jgi:hypothetical protein